MSPNESKWIWVQMNALLRHNKVNNRYTLCIEISGYNHAFIPLSNPLKVFGFSWISITNGLEELGCALLWPPPWLLRHCRIKVMAAAKQTSMTIVIDVKNVFYVFYFKIKNAFLTLFIFPTFFINKKRWAFLFLSLTTTFSSLVHIQINCTWL